MATVRLVSSYTNEGSLVAFCTFEMVSSQCFSNTFSSASSSATRFPSATVRTITPKFFGLMLCNNCFKRARSSLDLIFWETETLSLNGIRTRYRPAKDSSHVSRGPLVEIGSFTICTMTSCPCCKTFEMVPSLSMSGNIDAFDIG